MILIYVNDILIIGKTDKNIEQLVNILKKSSNMKAKWMSRMFLRLYLSKTDNNLRLSLKSRSEIIINDFDITLPQRELKTPLIKRMEGKLFKQSIF